jgi:hypothetical protein
MMLEKEMANNMTIMSVGQSIMLELEIRKGTNPSNPVNHDMVI